uniref:Uncharacterized protein n=1 Tax=Hyaloperonospora arabidopsidis (strain Emoy2) TaxID=559515 RepID=M4BEI2_HYAAE
MLVVPSLGVRLSKTHRNGALFLMRSVFVSVCRSGQDMWRRGERSHHVLECRVFTGTYGRRAKRHDTAIRATSGGLAGDFPGDNEVAFSRGQRPQTASPGRRRTYSVLTTWCVQ